ncbi:autotransporter-associated beta strand repeat-containing protein [Rariglobus hedericola]|uniref:PEP-CTERM sorting domain-containing protein n=1 Tax=Rariglobus hedericola TaxID=2597822 RepID=A0A556QL13_9BACT|nr:autotransporter-associated beta strand repeat-containing protein [Rariglobus hedericola]TSJ77292.1 hypothetical protein FPL22_14445 [Rariglobus hedericola]
MNVKFRLVISARTLRGRLSMASSVLASISGLALFSTSVQAATFTYTGNGTTADVWSAGTRWTGAAAPSSATDTTLVFSGAINANTTTTNDIAGPFLLNALTLSGSGSQFNNRIYTIAAGAIGSPSFTFSVDGANAPVINLNSNNTGLGTNISYTIGVNGAINGGSLVVQGNGNSTFNYSGILSDGNGAATLTKNGTSTIALAGTNSYTGGTILNAGGLSLNNASALGNGGALTINGGSLSNTSGSAITLNTHAESWNGDFTFGGNQYATTSALNLGTGAVTLGGDRTLTISATNNGSNALTVGGVIDDGVNTYGLTLAGSATAGTGTLILNGANTYGGPTTINAGVLQLGSLASLGGSGADTLVNSGGTLSTAYALDAATFARLNTLSSGTVAMAGVTSSTNLDLTGRNVSLGASGVSASTYSGILTPNGTTYRLGGGYGTLNFNSLLSGSRNLVVGGGGTPGTINLGVAGTYNGGTTVIGGVGTSASVLQTNLTGATTPFGSGAISLNNGVLGFGTGPTALTTGQNMAVSLGAVTFQGQNEIKLAKGSSTQPLPVSVTIDSLNRTNGVLFITPSAGANLGVSEKVFVTNPGSISLTPVNGMITGTVIDGTNKTFLTYGANGFVDAATTGTYGSNNIVGLSADPATTVRAYALRITTTPLSSSDNFIIGAGGFIANTGMNNAVGTLNFGSNHALMGFFGVSGDGNGLAINSTGGATFYGVGTRLVGANLNISGGINFAGGTWTLNSQPTGNESFQTTNPNAVTISRGATVTNSQGSKFTLASLSGDGLLTSNTNDGGGSVFQVTINGLNDTGTTTFSGGITDAFQSTLNIIKTGVNTQVLSGVNTYRGGTTVNAGTLKGTQTSGTPFGTGNVTLGGGKLSIAPYGSGANVAVSGANAVAGSTFIFNANSQLNLDKGANTSLTYTAGNSAAAANSVLVRGTNGTLIITPASGTAALGTATGEKFIVNGGVATTNGIASAAIIGQDSNANKDGTFLAYNATNGFTAAGVYTDTDFGSPSFANVEDVTTAGFALPGSTKVFALRNAGVLSIGTGNTLTIGDASSLPGGVILNGGSINGGTLAFDALLGANVPGVIYSNLVGGSISSVITGTAGVSIVGPGVTTLSGVNTYTTTTQVNDSTLSISSNANLGNTANSVGLNGGTLQSTATLNLGTRAVALNAGQNSLGGTFDVATGTDLTVGGVISSPSAGLVTGVGALYKKGAGNLKLSGANTFTGFTSVSEGTLTLSNSLALQYSTLTSGGIIFDSSVGSHAFTIGALSGSGNLNLMDNASNAVTLSVGNLGTYWNGAATVSTPDAGKATTYSGVLSGTGSLVKIGPGTLMLDGESTYTGQTKIQAGTLTVSSLNSVVGGTSSSSLGAPVTMGNGTIGIGATTSAGTLSYTGSGETTDRVVDLAGTTGGAAISANGTGALVFSSNLTATGVGAKTLTLSGSSESTIDNRIQGAIVDSSSGATAVTKSGANTWLLAGNNSYTGATIVGAAGTLKLGASGSSGNGPLGTVAAGTTVNSGGTLDLNGFTLTNAEALTLNGNGVSSGTSTAGALRNSSATGVNYSGLLTLGSASKIVANGNINLTNAGTITGATFGLTLDGIATGSSVTSIIGTTTGGVTKAGLGTWTLSGANTYTGTTAVSGGTLVLNANTGSLAASALTFNGNGGTFNYDNTSSSGVKAQNLGALAFSAGQGTVLSTLGGATSSTLTFASLTARTAGATGNFVTTGGTNGVSNIIKFTSGPTAGTLIDKGVFYNGSNYAAYDSTGFVRAYGVGDTGYLVAPTGATIGASTISNNVSVTGDITAQTTATANTINLNANSLTMSAVGQVLSTNGILSSGNSNATLGGTGGILQSGASGAELVVRVNGSSDQLTIGSIVRNNTNPSAFTKSGSGTLVLTGLNTYTGATAINAGTLMIGGAGNLGGGAYAGAIANNSTFAYNSSVSQTLSGAITGIGSVVKNGSGILTLSGANTYSGGTSIGAGTLVYTNSFTMSGANSISVAATGVAGTNYATVTSTAGALTFGGTLGINITASLTGGETFNLFTATTGSLAGDFGTTAGNVSITGGYLASLTNNGSGIWTGTDTNGSGLSFTFAASGINAGMLSVSAIPEPSAYVALAGALVLASALCSRRRRA